jgi:tRNA dimethylallyltransferase
MEIKNNLPLIAIVGPTASGKSALAMDIAKKFDGEIICADSRTIYKYMDIGTAKPDLDDIQQVQHWGLDIINPGESYSAADFKIYAEQKISEIRSRGHIPLLVGGTGLYVDSVIFDYQFGPKADPELRDKLQKMTVSQLQEYCKNNNVKLPKNLMNSRHLIRAIETNGITNRLNTSIIENCIVVGITTEKSIILDRIKSRILQMISCGVIDEAEKLGRAYGWDSESMKSNIYPLVKQYLDNKINKDEFIDKAITVDWHLAKRQMTWLKRNKFIQWGDIDEARQIIEKHLASIR